MKRLRTNRATWGAFSLALSIALGGCASGGSSGGKRGPVVIDRGFPSKAQLAAIVKTPLLPREEALKKGQAVDQWDLSGPFPEHPGSVPWQGEDPLVRAVAERVEARKSGLSVTESMQCYAREIGRFVAHHTQVPEDDLQAFAAGRCGVLPIAPSFLYSFPSEEPSNAAALEFFDEVVSKAPASSEVGVWTGNAAGRHVLMAAFGVPKVKLTSVEPVPNAAGAIRVRGSILSSTGWARAYTTAASMGFHLCETTGEATSVLPEFDVTCRVAEDDSYAVFDMHAAAPQALLGRQVLLLVLPIGDKVLSTFQSRPVYGVPAQGSLLDQFNALRRQLGREALREIPVQSQIANSLIPYYFTAAARNDFANVDFITLGMMAGWDVPGPLRDAHFLSFSGTLDQSGSNFLRQLLFFPSNRAVLLDPYARKAAHGTFRDEKRNALWGMFATYTPFEPQSYGDVETNLLDELDRQRRARGKPPVVRVETKEVHRALDYAMEKLARGDITPLQGLEQTLRVLSRRTMRAFNGRVAYALATDGWRSTFEGELVEADHLAVACKVGFFAAKGHHWGQYVSYIIAGTSFELNRGSAIPRRERIM